MTADTGVPASPLMPFFTRPVQRQKWGDTQVKPIVNWGDLFFDLFYVAAAYNLSSIIQADPNAQGFLYFCGCYFAVLWMWLDKMYFDSRFYVRDDVWHRLFEVTVLVVLATAVLHIRPVEFLESPSEHVDMFAFSLACVLQNFLTIWRYVEIYFWVDGQEAAKKSARRDMFAKLMPLGFYLAAMGKCLVCSAMNDFTIGMSLSHTLLL